MACPSPLELGHYISHVRGICNGEETTFDDWQSDTRRLSELLDRSSKTIYFYGDPRLLESARRAHLYIKEDLALRLRNIDGLQITYCVERGNVCQGVAGFEWETSAVTGIQVATDGRVSALRVE